MTDPKTGIHEPTVTLAQGIDYRDPGQRDPLHKTFRGHALKKRWQDLTEEHLSRDADNE